MQRTTLSLTAVGLLAFVSLRPLSGRDVPPPIDVRPPAAPPITETPEASHFAESVRRYTQSATPEELLANLRELIASLEAVETAYSKRADFPLEQHSRLHDALVTLERTWGESTETEEAATFIRADVNGDGRADLSDAVNILTRLFAQGGSFPCAKAADVNDSGAIDISDAVALLGTLFLGAASPPAPFPGCGADSSADILTCETPPCTSAVPAPKQPPTGAVRTQRIVAGVLAFTCSGLVCVCIGDADCNDMFSGSACGDIAYCSDLYGIPYCACMRI